MTQNKKTITIRVPEELANELQKISNVSAYFLHLAYVDMAGNDSRLATLIKKQKTIEERRTLFQLSNIDESLRRHARSRVRNDIFANTLELLRIEKTLNAGSERVCRIIDKEIEILESYTQGKKTGDEKTT